MHSCKLATSRVGWAEYMFSMKDERLPKITETKKQGGCMKRGRAQLRWDDCLKRDSRNADEEKHWIEKEASNR